MERMAVLSGVVQLTLHLCNSRSGVLCLFFEFSRGIIGLVEQFPKPRGLRFRCEEVVADDLFFSLHAARVSFAFFACAPQMIDGWTTP